MWSCAGRRYASGSVRYGLPDADRELCRSRLAAVAANGLRCSLCETSKQHGIIKFARKFARKRPCVCERNVRISLANHGQKRYTNKRKLSTGASAFLAAPVRTTGEALRERIGGSKRLVGLRTANGYPGDALRDQSFRDHREAAGFRPGPFGRAGCFSGRSDPKQQEREYFS